MAEMLTSDMISQQRARDEQFLASAVPNSPYDWRGVIRRLDDWCNAPSISTTMQILQAGDQGFTVHPRFDAYLSAQREFFAAAIALNPREIHD